MARHGDPTTLIVGQNRDLPEPWLVPLERIVGEMANSTAMPRACALSLSPGFQGRLNRAQLDELVSIASQHDVVHLHGIWDLGSIQFASRLGRLRIPYIVSAHGMLDDWALNHKGLKKKVYLRLLGRNYLRRAATVLTTAEAERDQVVRNAGVPIRTECIVPFVDHPIELQDEANLITEKYPEVLETDIRLLFLSRMHSQKGPDLLIRAVAQLIRDGRSIHLLMAGPGETSYVESLKRLGKAEGIDRHITWFGMVREPLKTALYQTADLFVLPTHQESFGMVLIEAMFAGLPVVTTHGPDTHRELKQGGARIVDRSVEAFAQAISQLLSQPELMKEQGQQGKAFVEQWLDNQRTLNRYREFYRAVTGMGHSAKINDANQNA